MRTPSDTAYRPGDYTCGVPSTVTGYVSCHSLSPENATHLAGTGVQVLIYRGPHRYTRTLRVPILRRKIPVTNRIKSSRYFCTGTTTKMIARRVHRHGIGGKIQREFTIASSMFPARSTYRNLRSRDRGSAGKYIASSRSRHPSFPLNLLTIT